MTPSPRTRSVVRRPPPFRTLFLVALLPGLGAPWGATGQTPEQRYTDWARPVFSADEYRARRAALSDALADAGGGILLVPSSDGLTHGDTFRQLDGFAWLTGLDVPGSLLALDADRGTALLFLPARDPRFENPGRPNDFPGRPLGDDPALAALAGLTRTAPADAVGDSLTDWAAEGRRFRVDAGRPGPAEPPAVPLIGALDPVATLLLHLDRRGIRPENAFEAVARVRMVKRPAELAVMRRAAAATMDAIRTTAARIRPGVDEATLQGVFEAGCRAAGADRIPFTPIVKSGPNSLWPWRILAAHYDRRNRTMDAGDLVILDVGCEVDGYVSDVGRTFPVGGRFTDVQREKLAVSTAAADAIIAAARPGVTFADLTRVAYDAIPDQEERYMQTPSFFGHHIGLAAGDPALPDAPLEAGMVFTVEPWYYNHDLGVSVFVEDVILITETGAEVLTRDLPRSADELERMIR
ncbi:MAG: Xaa-Pro peptidase family protein [Longimicrobiales bacterium]